MEEMFLFNNGHNMLWSEEMFLFNNGHNMLWSKGGNVFL